jgi:hypothetical protein
MKWITVGCVSALVGLIVGVVVMFGASSLASQNHVSSVMPVPSTRADVSVTANVTFVNSQIQQTLRQSGLFKQANISFEAPNLFAVAGIVETTFLGQTISVNAIVRMRVQVRDSRAVFTIEQVDVAGFNVPQAAINSLVERSRAQAEDQVNQLIQRSLQGTTLRLSNIRITSDAMTIDLVSP